MRMGEVVSNSSDLCEEFDPFGEMPEGVARNTWLNKQGWYGCLEVGEGGETHSISPYFRLKYPGQSTEYTEWMINIKDGFDGGEFWLKVHDGLPVVMDLLARWGNITLMDKAYRIMAGITGSGMEDHFIGEIVRKVRSQWDA